MLTNADLGELLWTAGREETDHRRRALEKASRASRFWPEEASEVARAGRSLTELRAVGPWVAARIHGWLEDPPPVPQPDETRRGFLTLAEVRRTLDADRAWEATPCADLQMHTTWSDGTLPLEEMVQSARALARSYVAVTDHSQALAIAHGMTAEQLAEQGRLIDELNRAFGAEGDPFRILRSMEVDLFPDGTLDMDDATLRTLDLVLGAFHSKLRSKEDETERYLAALRQPRLHILAHPKARMFGRRAGLSADWRRVFAEAARLGKALELDATVWRQDLGVELATIAREEGVAWFSIGSDAHTALELEFLPFGMATAALAGIPRESILNYRPAEFVLSWASGNTVGRPGPRSSG
ncbi:MAG TPA: PHP domain-containing protein [Actinomycetota bacterium]|jgi:histidinol phosphatase-like PHP family hydrolase|nr:PHP domain-containing protein [Actinomycetota bacterium]